MISPRRRAANEGVGLASSTFCRDCDRQFKLHWKLVFRSRALTARLAIGLGAATLAPLASLCFVASAKAQTAAPAAARQIGTVKAVSPNKLTIAADGGQSVEINVVDGARVLQLAPGTTDLKTAQSIALADISVGDRVLVTGHQDAADAFTASRVILMKSTDIAQKHEAEQEDWQRRGAGGLVGQVDPASGTITISSRSRKITVQTSSATIFKRYSDGSVKFEDAKLGTVSQVQPGDQLRVRGAKSADGSSIQAEEIVSGSFKNLAGTVISVDPAGEAFTLRDLASKKTYSIKVTVNSSVRALPPDAAARFATRARGAQQPGAGGAVGGGARPTPAAGVAVGDPHGGPAPDTGAAAGMDLSQLISRLPQGSIGQLHAGGALMVVASQAQPGTDTLTAITVLSGVEPILEATPKGSASMTLSPWNFGGEGEGGGI